MTYKNRPVMLNAMRWASPPKRSFSYDLRQVALGFGAEVFTSRQQYTVQGWTCEVDLLDASAIAAWEAFCEALAGRLHGFWLPVPVEAAEVVETLDDGRVRICAQGWADTWQDGPGVHLFFPETLPADGGMMTGQAVAVTGVEADVETELLTLEAGLEAAVGPATLVFRLHYVRLAEEVERGSMVAEGWMRQRLNVLELPHEYAAAETGVQPVFLYHFWFLPPVGLHWRYTSFATTVYSGNEAFTPWAITHGGLRQKITDPSQDLEVKAAYAAGHPFLLFLPVPCPTPMEVEVLMVSYADLETTTTLFRGQVLRVEDSGDMLSARCDCWGRHMARKIPRWMIGERCPWQVFEATTCKARRILHEAQTVVYSVDSTSRPPGMVLTPVQIRDAEKAANHFLGGKLETGYGAKCEIRTILTSAYNAGTGRLTLTLDIPLQHAVAGQPANLLPGCDGAAATCQSKFDNYLNFGGFPFVPGQNLSLMSLDSTVSEGGKK